MQYGNSPHPPVAAARAAASGLLGDTSTRDYSLKLKQFSAFAEPELRQAIGSLGLRSGMRILDAGCGTGEAVRWLLEAVSPGGRVLGLDLAKAHVAEARTKAAEALVLQGDLARPPFAPECFDLIWSVNTLHHLRDPIQGIHALTQLLRPGGRIALGQSSLVPDMYFAWDSRLERLTNEAVRQYYRDRYGLVEDELRAVRSVVGWLRRAALDNVTVRTFMIERVYPVPPMAEAYLRETIFLGTWGERLRPYLTANDYEKLQQLCDPRRPQFALRRPDFHFLQSFTLAVGRIPP